MLNRDSGDGNRSRQAALLVSLLALAVPVTSTALAPDWAGGELGLLVWILPLVPSFLLSFHHGWKGASIALAAGMAAIALTQVILVLTGSSQGPPTQFFLAFTVVLIMVSLGSGWIATSLRHSLQRAQNEAFTDPGTGLPNRRAAALFLEKAFFAAQRGGRLAVVIFDLDHFKSINDRHGHSTGDRVLRAFAEILASATRGMDLSARHGGEEFLSIVHGGDAEGALVFADRIRQAFADAAPVPGATVSAGIAEYEAGMAAPDVLVAAADQALYRAKSGGRNRVEVLRSMGRKADGIEPLAAASAHEQPRVLVVDDDQAVRRVMAKGLQRLGYTVVEADSAKRAMEIVRGDGPVSLVVTDVVMPDVSGFRLMEMIAETQPGVRAVYVSGYSQEQVDWAGVPGAASAFVRKPLTIDELGRAVSEVLARATPARVEPSSTGR